MPTVLPCSISIASSLLQFKFCFSLASVLLACRTYRVICLGLDLYLSSISHHRVIILRWIMATRVTRSDRVYLVWMFTPLRYVSLSVEMRSDRLALDDSVWSSSSQQTRLLGVLVSFFSCYLLMESSRCSNLMHQCLVFSHSQFVHRSSFFPCRQ